LIPEGFLLCRDVPIARTGEQLYADGEVPGIEPGPDGVIRVQRDPEEVFREETLASFAGKPVTNDHPPEGVSPANWRRYSVGTTQNPRRMGDLLVADLLVTEASAIRAVRSGKRQVSCGYDADYQSTGPGRGRQINIVGNHVALVERGRCGSRCSIGDQAMPKQSRWNRFRDRIMKAVRDKDETAAEEELEKVEDAMEEGEEKEKKDKTEDAIAKLAATVDALSKAVSAMAKDKAKDKAKDEDPDEKEKEDGEKEKKTGDCAAFKDSAQLVMTRAAILAPGHEIKIPILDSKDSATADAALCQCRRAALKAAYATADGKSVIDPFLSGKTADFDALDRATVDAMFAGASELMRAKNNAKLVAVAKVRDFGKTPPTNADINKRNQEFWSKRGSP